jgi:hypothetical protein
MTTTCRVCLAFVFAPLVSLGAQAPLTAEQQHDVLNELASHLDREYVFPSTAQQMIAALKSAESSGRYRAMRDASMFADSLTADLQRVSHDRHLRVLYRGQAANGPGPQGPPPQFLKFEKLDSNIGYLELFGFPPAERLARELDPAMQALASSDALIIDLRQNGGGSPEGVMYLAGYLMKPNTLVARIFSRPTGDTTEMRVLEAPGPHYDRDVYILTSRRTFSAAEAAAYHLKHLGRATVVGDTTGGGAHRINGARLPYDLVVLVPQTRPINVVTGGDWEGTGVIPDIPVKADDALAAARREIARRRERR